MSDRTAGFVFQYRSGHDASICSDCLNKQPVTRNALVRLVDIPPFAVALKDLIPRPEVQLLVADMPNGRAKLYVGFDGPIESVRVLFMYVKGTKGYIESVSCPSAIFTSEIGQLALTIGVAARPKPWWRFW